MRTYIITKKDTGCARSCAISDFDAEIVVPTDGEKYQYLITNGSRLGGQIITLRILRELCQRQIKDCAVVILGIPVTQKVRAALDLLLKNNKVVVK